MSKGFVELVSRPSLEMATEERQANPLEESKAPVSPRRSLTPLQVPSDSKPAASLLPSSSFTLSLAVPSTRIFEAFRATVSLNQYQVIEQTSSVATAVYKQPMSWRDAIMCCLPVTGRVGSSRHLAAIRLSICQKSEVQKVTLTGLYGGMQPLRKFAQDFKSAMDKTQGSMPTASGRSSIQNTSMTMRFRVLDESDDEEDAMPSKQSSYYQYVKIMTSEAYSLGRNITLFLENFLNQYRNIDESAKLLPQPMESVKAMIEETISTLDSQMRSTDDRLSRPAVEKFIFSKVYPHLFAMYRARLSDSDSRLSLSQSQIREMTAEVVMERLQVDSNLRLSSLSKPYQSAIDVLADLNELQTPLEKLNCFLKMAALLQTEILDFWKGKVELESMDQELPLLIFVLGKCSAQGLLAEIRFLLDYIGTDDEFESEQHLLVNCEMAGKFLSSNWS